MLGGCPSTAGIWVSLDICHFDYQKSASCFSFTGCVDVGLTNTNFIRFGFGLGGNKYMPLVSCPDCGHQVSSRAPSCPHCGAPISTAKEDKAIGTPVETIQQTSKHLKKNTAISAVIMFFGFLLLIPSICTSKVSALLYVGLALTIIGLAWLLYTKIQIWWHHK